MSAATESYVKKLRADHDALRQQLSTVLEREQRYKHETELLAKAIQDMAVGAGILRKDAPLTGPILLMICQDITDCMMQSSEREQALGVVVNEIQQLVHDDAGFCEHLGRDLVELLTSFDNQAVERRDLIKQAEALEVIVSCGELLSATDILEQARLLRQRAANLDGKG